MKRRNVVIKNASDFVHRRFQLSAVREELHSSENSVCHASRSHCFSCENEASMGARDLTQCWSRVKWKGSIRGRTTVSHIPYRPIASPSDVSASQSPIPTQEPPMKKLATAIAITAALAAAATHQYLHASTDPHQSDLQSKLHASSKPCRRPSRTSSAIPLSPNIWRSPRKPSQAGRNSWQPESTETTSMSSTSTGQPWASSRTPPSS
jgi:hypothetical protein